ncbi:MAG: [protein-PII] uridylyltransferase [Verrucomicrobia bacterium]|nr:MAG: [protein-PII] uridylyltransferase [Verrucomicrobiota bacterium]PYK43777.1 MAG: [protein-PII] uridylyltransferase [Verrucomicrobiota bacterium]
MKASRELEKVLAHAESRLAPTGARRPTEVLPLYKKFLKVEEHRLRLRHQAGGSGREICARRAELVNVLLRYAFGAASSVAARENGELELPLALIALGGYGRGELNPFSDVDVMLLHRQSAEVSPRLKEMVNQILYLLWDSGFKVGHSTRSIKEAIAQANSDMRTKTAMLEAQFLAGDTQLAREFREQFRAKCVVGHERDYVEMRMDDQVARHKKFGDSVFLQEPNLKSGCGGLRDYQNLLWITYFKEGSLSTNQLVGKDWLSESDQRRIERAYDFLLRLRTDLHYATGRATDILHLNLQEQIASRLGYSARKGQLRSESLMRDYYGHTRNILRVTERITQQFVRGHVTSKTRSLFSFLPLARANKTPLGQFFFIENKQLHPARRDVFRNDPEQIMRAFELAQEHEVDISPELEDFLSRSLRHVTRTYQYARGPRAIFKSILSQKGRVGRILRMMHRVDFLGRYIPEFGQLTCLVQHEFLHRYTADEHTLVCIDKLDALAKTDDPKLIHYRKLFERLPDPFVLYLALLLHDSGKAVGRPHSEASALFAQRVAARLQLTPEQRKSLILLVDHHLTMSKMAQQRNLDDPTTVMEFAQIIKEQKNLDALMLLTLADGQGTSADTWSDWKESLVWQLFHDSSRYLADRKSYHEQTRIARESLRASVAENLSPEYAEEIESHFEYMPDHYFRATSVPEIVEHVKLFRSFLENILSAREFPLAPAVEWKVVPEEGHTVMAFCTWERERLLAKVAGSFSVVPLNILSADIFPRDDNAVLGVFRVCDTKARPVSSPRDFDLVERTLQRALEDETFDFGPPIEKAKRSSLRPAVGIEFPTRITIDNKTHPTYTLIEFQAADRIGLLYDVLSCLDRENILVPLFRINTQAGAAIDTLYAVDAFSHAKIADLQRIRAVQQHLKHAILRG